MIVMRRFFTVLGACVASTAAVAGELPADPLNSPMWLTMAKRFFGDAAVVLDERIKITVPSTVENQAQVPVTADARGLEGVEKLIIFADLNPIQHIATLTPLKAHAYVSLRVKIEQATPVRAAALTRDGIWRVGSAFLEAAGGGCSAPAMARNDENWADTLGHVQGRLWQEADGSTRARFRVRHPMDTGLAKDNTPAFYIERLKMRSPAGEPLAEIEMFEPVSEDPTMTFMLRLPKTERGIDIEGRDNNGETYQFNLPASWKQSSVSPPTKVTAK
jgi:sulfur-oxidizing protein SoxY